MVGFKKNLKIQSRQQDNFITRIKLKQMHIIIQVI